MQTGPIVAELDPPRNVIACLLACRVDGPVYQLDFKRAVERFGERIIEADPCPGPRQSRLALRDRLEGAAGPPGVVAQGGGDADRSGQPQDGDHWVAQACRDARAAGGADLGPVFIEVVVADVLWGSRPGWRERSDGSSRSAIDQNRVVTPQVLHEATCPATAGVKAAATTSTTPTKTCCKSSPRRGLVQRRTTGWGPPENGPSAGGLRCPSGRG